MLTIWKKIDILQELPQCDTDMKWANEFRKSAHRLAGHREAKPSVFKNHGIAKHSKMRYAHTQRWAVLFRTERGGRAWRPGLTMFTLTVVKRRDETPEVGVRKKIHLCNVYNLQRAFVYMISLYSQNDLQSRTLSHFTSKELLLRKMLPPVAMLPLWVLGASPSLAIFSLLLFFLSWERLSLWCKC